MFTVAASSRPYTSTASEWSTETSDRQHRIERSRVQAMLGERVAHRGDVHERGRAGGVVHEHPHRLHLDLGFARAVPFPIQDRGDRRFALAGGLGARHVLQQDAQEPPGAS
jgi:hypothetical protein